MRAPLLGQQLRSGQRPTLGLMARHPWAVARTDHSSLGGRGSLVPTQWCVSFSLLSPCPLQAGDSLGDGGSVLDFVSVKAYSDVSLGISVLGSLGRSCRVHPPAVRHRHRVSGSAASRWPLVLCPPACGAVDRGTGLAHCCPSSLLGGRPGLVRWLWVRAPILRSTLDGSRPGWPGPFS